MTKALYCCMAGMPCATVHYPCRESTFTSVLAVQYLLDWLLRRAGCPWLEHDRRNYLLTQAHIRDCADLGNQE
jgi:hypothetical protein